MVLAVGGDLSVIVVLRVELRTAGLAVLRVDAVLARRVPSQDHPVKPARRTGQGTSRGTIDLQLGVR